MRSILAAVVMLGLLPILTRAEDADRMREAVALARGLPIVQKAAANYPKHRQCFACHHQTLPMLAMTAARDAGTMVDAELLQSQAEFTRKSFAARLEDMKKGMGIGGRAMTVAYGLWALQLADAKPDETTEAMVTYLLKTQKPEGCWTPQTTRPPLEESSLMNTVLAARGLKHYAADAQRPEVEAAIAKAKKWLPTAPVKSQEDRAARLWGLVLFGEELATARREVLQAQKDDGGWAQLDDMKSDAYATGQTLFVLRTAGLPTTDPAYQRGVAFLLKTQGDDGSWLVETRSKPIQVYFDNGDPHGKHQFISTPATSWAVAAIAAGWKR